MSSCEANIGSCALITCFDRRAITDTQMGFIFATCA